jgi:hypothetical protein
MPILHTPPPEKHSLRSRNIRIFHLTDTWPFISADSVRVEATGLRQSVLRSCVEVNHAKNGSEPTPERQSGVGRSVSSGKRSVKLDPALKSWLDNVIIPALVREYIAETEKHNRLAMTGGSELPSD